MRRFGLVGYPLKVSDSPILFKYFFKRDQFNHCSYELFPVEDASTLKESIQAIPDLRGFNVTIPHKQNCFKLCDQLSDEPLDTGAVNTVVIQNGQWIGYNTDVYGFEKSLASFIPNPHFKALILGTGGASKAVAHVLNKLGIPFQFVSRKTGKNFLSYRQLDKEIIESHRLIINTTPLGMKPNGNTLPDFPYSFLTSEHYLFDLVYKPVITKFLAMGLKSGCHVKNGLQMLSLQAQKAWIIWKPFAQ
jgi:shikimate dehydrogenase